MIYIIVALKAEAQAFIDKKVEAKIIISGIGVENMRRATKIVVQQMTKGDKLLNVGICGANHEYKIGQLIDGSEENISCVDKAICEDDKYRLVDMESEGFLQASLGVEHRYIFKIVSDHFEPHTVTKDGAKKLIFDKIDNIMEKIK